MDMDEPVGKGAKSFYFYVFPTPGVHENYLDVEFKTVDAKENFQEDLKAQLQAQGGRECQAGQARRRPPGRRGRSPPFRGGRERAPAPARRQGPRAARLAYPPCPHPGANRRQQRLPIGLRGVEDCARIVRLTRGKTSGQAWKWHGSESFDHWLLLSLPREEVTLSR